MAAKALRVEDVMQTQVRTVGPEQSLPDLERAFLEARVGAFPVVEQGRLIGLVSRSDVVRQIVTEQSYGEMLSEFYVDETGFSRPEPAESLREVAERAGARVESMRVRDVMSRSLVTAEPDAPLEEAAKLLLDRHIHRVPVTRDGELVGILSSLDVVRLVAEGRLAPR